MANVRPKTIIQQRLQGVSISETQTDVSNRGLKLIIDEPTERGGTNQGYTPIETLWAALLGCTNVIGHRVAQANGVHFESMKLRIEVDFDRRGVSMEHAVEVPFPSATLFIDVKTNADAASLDNVKRDLAKYCPVANVIRQSGTELREVWTVSK